MYNLNPTNDAVPGSNPTPSPTRFTRHLALAVGLYFLAGCEKIEMQTEPADKVQMASGREDYLPTTAKEKELVVNLQKTTEVLKNSTLTPRTLPLSMPLSPRRFIQTSLSC